MVVGSEEKMPDVTVEFSYEGEKVATSIAESREFKTGSRGYGFYGKIRINEKRYQVSLSIVEIGSKNGGETSK